jgi:hypothetical protein
VGDGENPCPEKTWIKVEGSTKRCPICRKAWKLLHSKNYHKKYGLEIARREREEDKEALEEALEAIPEMSNPKAATKFLDRLINSV